MQSAWWRKYQFPMLKPEHFTFTKICTKHPIQDFTLLSLLFLLWLAVGVQCSSFLVFQFNTVHLRDSLLLCWSLFAYNTPFSFRRDQPVWGLFFPSAKLQNCQIRIVAVIGVINYDKVYLWRISGRRLYSPVNPSSKPESMWKEMKLPHKRLDGESLSFSQWEKQVEAPGVLTFCKHLHFILSNYIFTIKYR